ncbi:MAG: hypothetical protein V9E83_03765 [Baekduia sp.]
MMVSSYLPELFGLCDRIAVMRRGEVVHLPAAAEWTEQTLMTHRRWGLTWRGIL